MPARWYRSLYWRIGLGFVFGLAAMLVAQGVLLVWIFPRFGPTVPAQPDRFARTMALELTEALEREPGLDVSDFVDSQFGNNALPFLILMADGREVKNGGPFSEELRPAAEARLRRGPDFPRIGGDFPRPERGWRFDRFGRGAGFLPLRNVVLPIVVAGDVKGVVAVLPRAPFGFLLRRFAPMLTLVATSVLGVGALLAAIVIFGPARRRLRAVEEAARRLGAGDLTARAPARGGDEVAAVAAAFNAMAGDLAARADALAISDRARRQLLADVSHELTTPVTTMRGYLETLTMSELALDEATRERYLRIIGDETGRLERIIGDLLDLAKLESGGGSLVIGDVSMAQLFERVTSRHERACAEAGVRFETFIEGGADTMPGDRDRIEQALQNLAANALRYAPAGSVVQLRATRDSDQLVLGVIDEGAGIADEHLPYVFDRFYKAEPSRAVRQSGGPAPNGSGLGLSIVKAIVERHGGTATVTSRPGRTEFALRFPLDSTTDPEPAVTSNSN